MDYTHNRKSMGNNNLKARIIELYHSNLWHAEVTNTIDSILQTLNSKRMQAQVDNCVKL